MDGVWAFKGKNEFGAVTFLPEWEYIALKDRKVYIVYDSDAAINPHVKMALERLTEHLHHKGAKVQIIHLPHDGNGKTGVDDFLLTHPIDQLIALAGPMDEKPKPLDPLVELLDDSPSGMTKPLQLIDGHAYAAVWPWVKTTKSEGLDRKTGQIIRHVPPIVTTERRLFVVRDDGAIFGAGGGEPLDASGLDIRLTTIPRDSRLWSTKGVKAYRSGHRADPLDVFKRIVSLIDRYMSFNRSLTDQQTMCEMVACYALATWFLDAFNVIGFLWPNGGYGSGKTKLGILICEVAYLGEALLAGSTYATLRDLADFGATLLFDDAENLSDPKKSDPDKRNLLLAGNRKGSSVAVKEPGPDGTWRTRYVNTYCARMFTATRVPDPILASRSIVIPLVRTADRQKANAEVLDHSVWPCDRQQLLDDLWAVALANLAQMPGHEAAVNETAPLVARDLEPWRAVLSAAHWLNDLGVNGLYERICKLAEDYQKERTELETVNLTRLVVRALIELLAPSAPSAPFAPSVGEGAIVEIGASEVAARINQIALEDDLIEADEVSGFTNERRVGKVLSSLRLPHAKRETKAEKRKRRLSIGQLDDIARSYGFPPILPDEVPPSPTNGALGGNGGNGASPTALLHESDLVEA